MKLWNWAPAGCPHQLLFCSYTPGVLCPALSPAVLVYCPPFSHVLLLCCGPPCPALLAVLAYFVASFAPNLDVANALLPTYIVTLLFFTGFLFKLDMIPK